MGTERTFGFASGAGGIEDCRVVFGLYRYGGQRTIRQCVPIDGRANDCFEMLALGAKVKTAAQPYGPPLLASSRETLVKYWGDVDLILVEKKCEGVIACSLQHSQASMNVCSIPSARM